MQQRMGRTLDLVPTLSHPNPKDRGIIWEVTVAISPVQCQVAHCFQAGYANPSFRSAKPGGHPWVQSLKCFITFKIVLPPGLPI